MKKWPILLIAFTLLALLVYAFLPERVPVELGQATLGELRISVEEDGKTRVRNRFTLSAPLSGRLLRIELKPGAQIQAGQTIAFIQPTSPNLLDSRSLEQARARAESAQAIFAKAKSESDRAQAASRFAESERKRIVSLAEKNLATQQELSQAQTNSELRQYEERAAFQAIKAAEQDLRGARAALLMPAQEGKAEPFQVKAPTSGQVFRVMRESEGFVASGEPLLEYADTADLEIVVDLLSKDAVRVPLGAPVQIEHWGGEAVLEGSVRLLEPSGFTKLSALGVEEQRVNVLIELKSPFEERKGLGDGFRVETDIQIWKEDQVLQVPESALFWLDDSWRVFQSVSEKAILTRVVVGHRNGEQAQILDGLKAGDQVILHPGDAIQSGVKLRVIE